MISHHYAMTFGAAYNWLVLIAISMAGVLIRVYFVSRHKAHERGGRTSPVHAVLAVVTLAAVAFVLAPRGTNAPGIATDAGGAQEFERVQAIVAQRCVHRRAPTQRGSRAACAMCCWTHPSALIRFTDSSAVATRAMPIGNLTITEGRRCSPGPNLAPHTEREDRAQSSAHIVTSSRDLIGYGRTPPHPHWPKQARIALQFVLNHEEGGEFCSVWRSGFETFLSESSARKPFPCGT
jgi:hypothetical protein